MISQTSLILSLALLLILAYQDIKQREIDDRILIITGIIGAITLPLENLTLPLTNIVLVTAIMAIIYYLGTKSPLLYIGDGDLKTIITLAIINWTEPGYALIAIFLASLLIVATTPIYYLIYNILRKTPINKQLKKHKLTLYLLGKLTKISKIDYFHTPLEQITLKNGKENRKFTLIPNIEPEKEIQKLKKLVKQGKIKDQIWASPLTPHIVFILAAYLGYYIVTL